MGLSCAKDGYGKGRIGSIIRLYENERKKEFRNSVKLILLGTGECGKTTILQQFQNLYGAGLTEEERIGLKPTIFTNVIEGTQEVLVLLGHMGVEDLDRASQLIATIEISYADSSTLKFMPEIVKALMLLYNYPGFQEIFTKRRNELQVPQTYEYFMEKLKQYPRWGGDKWTPSIQDSLRVRKRTTGTYTIKFNFETIRINLTDVGGQFGERSHWLSLFKDVQGLIYVTSLVDYNLLCFEDGKTNRLVDSMNEWQKICKLYETSKERTSAQSATPAKFTAQSAIILFLNKTDLLKEEIERCQPTGGIKISDEVLTQLKAPPVPPYNENLTSNDNFNITVQWFRDLYANRLGNNKSDIFVFETNALDERKMAKVMQAIHSQVFGHLFKVFNFTNSL